MIKYKSLLFLSLFLTFLSTLSSVKLWSTDMEHSVACLEAKANVCCVKFNPESRYHLSFGSAGKHLCTYGENVST